MTVYENVAYPLQIRRVRRADIRERVFRMLELVGLKDYHDRPATRLSGGQQQRVSLARALVYSPHVLLLDEPLSSLDARLRDEMRRQIRSLQRQLGVTVVFVTHDQREAFSMSDHVAVLRQGKLEQLGTPQEVYLHPTSPYVRDFLGRSLVLHGAFVGLNGPRAVVQIEDMAGTLEVPLPADAGGDDLERLELGAQVKLTIRPEYLRVASKDALGGAGCVSARVEEILYLGEGHEYVVNLGSHNEVIALPGDVLARPGEQLVLELDPAAMTLWPD
jgi:ABC-type Fe3+/spermidine/putrescine transport system ATPase subunit